MGIKGFLNTKYEQEYTGAMCTNAVIRRVFDDVERIGCTVRTLNALKLNPKLMDDCFNKSGLLPGYNDVWNHFLASMFSVGGSLRDQNLSQVNDEYVRTVL